MNFKNVARKVALGAALALGALAAGFVLSSAPHSRKTVPESAKPIQAELFAWMGSLPQARRDEPYYPAGSVRSLDDPAFGPHMAELGLYDPEAFLESTPTLFSALEEDVAYKMPVIFVHGMRGSPRDFSAMLSSLDRTQYKPWFFHYPSGMDLDQSAQLFYELFLSGTVLPTGDVPVVIVAHSSGGLVVREALNLYGSTGIEARVRLLVTLATPFGGQRETAHEIEGARNQVAAWRDLEPNGVFLRQLFRKRLPADTLHAAVYAYLDADRLARGTADDGVVAVSSQLAPPARAQFARVLGLRAAHASVLQDRAAIRWVMSTIEEVTGLPTEPERPAVAATQP
jgi:pimeloyl-ACP methyl ester carboxylesterase